VNELDDVWEKMFAESRAENASAPPGILSEFLALKASNDELRTRAVDWLLMVFTELAAHANRRSAGIEIERKEPHNFSAFGANMAGVKIDLRQGVRCLTVEAGWTRLPSDGFMRGGALAVAHISHFGLKRHSSDFALLKIDDRPQWHSIDSDNMARPIEVPDLARHLAILADLHK